MLTRREAICQGAACAAFSISAPGVGADTYRRPLHEPVTPFTDPNFKLAILSAMMADGIIDLGTPYDLAAHVLGRPVDLEIEGWSPIAEVRDYLARYQIFQPQLDRIETIELDGGIDIYPYIHYFWGGETEEFDIATIEGIKACRNLRSLLVSSMIEKFDLALLPRETVQELELGVGLRNIEALDDMPSLQTVQIMDNAIYEDVSDPDHPTRALMERLKARGVSVRVHWMSYVGNTPPPAFE